MLLAGHALATVEMFQELWRRQVQEEMKSGKAETLFPMCSEEFLIVRSAVQVRPNSLHN
jgi:hypothetical protein